MLDRGWKLRREPDGEWMEISRMPQQVHEILYEKGKISDDFTIGLGEDSQWVAESDWTYVCSFTAHPRGQRPLLRFERLDTLAEIWLNGRFLARSESFYLPLEVEAGELREGENTLEIRFESPYRYLREHPLPPAWEGRMRHCKLIRKPPCDFSDYLGAKPYLTPIGVAGDVLILWRDASSWLWTNAQTTLSPDNSRAQVIFSAAAEQAGDLRAAAVLLDPDGKIVAEESMTLREEDGEQHASAEFTVQSPRLWWPRGFGGQPLYTVRFDLYRGQELIDREEKQIGLRRIEMNENFDLRVNGRAIRLWGSNLPPLDGKTHRYNPERAKVLLDLVEQAHMNTLRIWGEGEVFDDPLYQECDRRGILLWQEFFHGYGLQPDSPDYFSLCLREAEYLVRRLRHHPCIFMWCGGNEGIMGGEFDSLEKDPTGSALYQEYGALCKKLDPGRYFHLNSPTGGAYANDPRAGDTHGYEMWWHVPGYRYPVAFSEHMRVSPPALKSMKRFIPAQDLWPADFVDSTLYSKNNEQLLPPAWMARAGGMLSLKSGRVEQFYDAQTPEELIYKFSAAHAKSFKEGIERSRMGRPSGEEERICRCHLIWKFSDTFPLIYSAIVDYYLEPFIPYYTARRAYDPVLPCFDLGERSFLWLCNDSAFDVSGTLEYGVFCPRENRFLAKQSVSCSMPSGSSGEIICIDQLGAFRSENLLWTRFTDPERGIDVENFQLTDIERRLRFPEAVLKLTPLKDGVLVESDRYAHCVELSAEEDGDAFGWRFEDNYFHLLPESPRFIRILGGHNQGTLHAKAHYSPHVTTVSWRRGEDGASN